MKVVKQSKRNVVSRHFHAKNDKEKIAAWRLDLGRILDVFNVRSIVPAWHSLTLHSQTELIINIHGTVSDTHVMVSDTRAMVSDTRVMVSDNNVMISDIHRTVVRSQETSGGKNTSVSDTRVPVVT